MKKLVAINQTTKATSQYGRMVSVGDFETHQFIRGSRYLLVVKAKCSQAANCQLPKEMTTIQQVLGHRYLESYK